MMSFDGTMIIIFISFVVYMAFMKSFFFDPVMNVKMEREALVESSHQEVAKANQKAQQLDLEVAQKLGEARKTAQSLIQKMRDESSAQAATTLQKTKADINARMDQQKAELDSSKEAIYSALAQEQDEWMQAVVKKIQASSSERSHAGSVSSS